METESAEKTLEEQTLGGGESRSRKIPEEKDFGGEESGEGIIGGSHFGGSLKREMRNAAWLVWHPFQRHGKRGIFGGETLAEKTLEEENLGGGFLRIWRIWRFVYSKISSVQGRRILLNGHSFYQPGRNALHCGLEGSGPEGQANRW